MIGLEHLQSSGKTEVIKLDGHAGRRRLQPYSWEDLQSLPKREPLIKGLLDRRAISVVYGESNCGKTFLTLDIALHIAQGRPWLGKRVRPGNVLYVAAEGGLGVAERLRAFELHHKVTEAPSLYLLPSGIDLRSADADAREIVKEAHIIDQVELIVIDTLARAMAGGNENGPDDMGAFVGNIDLIREQTGAHILIVHHAGKDTAKGGRGHSSLRAAVDTEIEVTKDGGGIVTAEVKKQRDGRTGDKHIFALQSVHLGEDGDGDPVSSCVLIESDTPAKDRAKVSGRQHHALQMFHNLAAERPQRGIPKKGMNELTFVRMDHFRTALKSGNIVTSDDPDSVRRGIAKVIEELVLKGILSTWEDKVWFTG